MSVHLTVEQGSPEWFQARSGAITASMFSECRKRLKSGPNKGQLSQAAKDYAFKLAVERISGEPLNDPQFDPWQARRGRELEPEALLAYEYRTKTMVEQTGLALTEDGKFGASVDGLVGRDGGVEVKCFLAASKLAPILFDGDIGDCVDQIQGAMWITGRKWHDFVLYCPALKSINKHLTVIRQERDDEYIEAMQKDLLLFDLYVSEIEDKLRN